MIYFSLSDLSKNSDSRPKASPGSMKPGLGTADLPWNSVEHRYRAIGYVSPAQRHASEDTDILAARHSLYATVRAMNPARGSGPTRDWSSVGPVTLNPERVGVIKAHVNSMNNQSLAA